LAGRPKLRWENDIKGLRIMEINKWTWIKCIQDRVKWKEVQGGSNMTGTDLYVNKPHCAAAVRP